MGRSPVVVALSKRSVTAVPAVTVCWCCGSSSFGAVIETPAIGPATVGLRGFSLFLVHPARVPVTTNAAASRYPVLRIEVSLGRPRRRPGRPRSFRLSLGLSALAAAVL